MLFVASFCSFLYSSIQFRMIQEKALYQRIDPKCSHNNLHICVPCCFTIEESLIKRNVACKIRNWLLFHTDSFSMKTQAPAPFTNFFELKNHKNSSSKQWTTLTKIINHFQHWLQIACCLALVFPFALSVMLVMFPFSSTIFQSSVINRNFLVKYAFAEFWLPDLTMH